MRLSLFWLLKRSQQTLQVQMRLIDICTNDTCSQNQCRTCKQWSPCIPSSLLYGRSGSSNDIFSSSSVNWTSHVCNLVLLLVLLTTLPVFLPRQVSLRAYLLKIVSELEGWGYTHALVFFPLLCPSTPVRPYHSDSVFSLLCSDSFAHVSSLPSVPHLPKHEVK